MPRNLLLRSIAAAGLAVGSALAGTTPAAAQAATGPAARAEAAPQPALASIRSHQVWRDALPERIDPADVEVVILSPDSQCRPPPLKSFLGLQAPSLNPVTGAFCRRIASFVQSPPEPLPLAVRVHTPAQAAREPAAVLAGVEPAPTRRYVALVHWTWAMAQRENHWLFEIAVIDRSDGRWLWHGARAHPITPLPKWQDETELRALRALLRHELPRDLLQAAWWREHVPVPGSRWVPMAEVAGYRPAADRAGLVIVNTYTSSTPHVEGIVLKLWPAGSAEVDETERLRQGDWSQSSTVRIAQATPEIPSWTYAVLDLPPGEYATRLGRDAGRLTLAPGQLAIVRVERALLTNARDGAQASEAWWREKVLGERGRHAFLADPPSRGPAPVVPYFVDASR